MRRISFTAPDLHDFVSASPDDHVKRFFQSGETAEESDRPCMRDYTPRSVDIALGRLAID
jgi:NADPH-dependent ferric siderophore reductase